jgi:hypothetical protein
MKFRLSLLSTGNLTASCHIQDADSGADQKRIQVRVRNTAHKLYSGSIILAQSGSKIKQLKKWLQILLKKYIYILDFLDSWFEF